MKDLRNQFYKKLIVFILLVAGGVLFSYIQSASAVQYECKCRSGSFSYFDSANDTTAYSACESQCGGAGTVSYVAANGCQTDADCSGNQKICQNGFCVDAPATCSPACDSFVEECQQNPEDGSYSCVPRNASGCPGGCPSGNECRWDDTDRSWSCEPVSESNCYNDCLGRGNTPTECQAACGGSGGGGTGGSTGGGGTGPLTRIGNVVMPNFLSCDSVSTCITNIADFIIKYIATPLAVFMIILAGFRFVLAQGNDEKLQVARKNFIWTAIGVGIVFASNILIVYIEELLGGRQGGTLTGFIERLKGTLNLVIAVLFSLTTAYFIWGIIQYVVSGGDEQKLEQGKKHMVWGIIGMAIMGAAWGIVTIIKNYIQ